MDIDVRKLTVEVRRKLIEDIKKIDSAGNRGCN